MHEGARDLEAAPGKGGRRRRLAGGLLVFLLAGGAWAAYAFDLVPFGEDVTAARDTAGPVHSLETIVTNLNTPQGGLFVRVRVELEMSGPQALEELKKKEAAVLDEILAALRSRTLADLQGAEGMRRLGADLRSQINRLLGRESVRSVYFTEFIIQ